MSSRSARHASIQRSRPPSLPGRQSPIAGNHRGLRPFYAIGFLLIAGVYFGSNVAPGGGERCDSAPGPILKEGRNCWRIASAKRAAVLIDGADYYAALEKVAAQGAQVHHYRRLGFRRRHQAASDRTGLLPSSAISCARWWRKIPSCRSACWSGAWRCCMRPAPRCRCCSARPGKGIRASRCGSTASIRCMARITRRSSASTIPLPSSAAWTSPSAAGTPPSTRRARTAQGSGWRALSAGA